MSLCRQQLLQMPLNIFFKPSFLDLNVADGLSSFCRALGRGAGTAGRRCIRERARTARGRGVIENNNSTYVKSTETSAPLHEHTVTPLHCEDTGSRDTTSLVYDYALTECGACVNNVTFSDLTTGARAKAWWVGASFYTRGSVSITSLSPLSLSIYLLSVVLPRVATTVWSLLHDQPARHEHSRPRRARALARWTGH